MASTFSPSLKIELIGNGDQSGTWGTTTNNNLGTLIEQAITGVLQIPMTNIDYTLSTLNGISDEARNAVIVLSGTNSAVRNIIAPAVPKTYIISNNTSGGFAVNIKTAASAGVSIANGVTMIVFCNGTQFFPATKNYASTNTADTAVIRDGSGNFAANVITANTVTQAAGDNSTKLASTAYVNAAATTAIQLLHPVGSIYTSTVATNPATLFGFGTWVAFGAGRVMIGDGGGFVAGGTGGSANSVIVDHSHNYSGTTSTTTALTGSATYISETWAGYGVASGIFSKVGGFNAGLTPDDPDTSATGQLNINANHNHSFSGTTAGANGGQSGTNANLQPYIVVYMWNRTA
jgi:hypothetical protein